MRYLFVLLALALPARAQTLNALGIDRLNRDAQSLWAHDGIPLAQAAAMAEAQKLVGVQHNVDSKTYATIIGINSITLNCPIAPGVTKLDQNGVAVALPLSGTWTVAASVRVHGHAHLIFFDVDDTFNVNITLSNVSASLSAVLDSTDPSAPKVVKVNPPVVHFTLGVSSSNFIVNVLGFITGALVNGIPNAVMVAAANYAAAKLDVMASNNPPLLNAGGPALAPVRRGNLELAASKLGDEIEQHRTPFGPILEMQFDQPYAGTWGQSIQDPAFNPGNPAGPGSYGDSGEMTGHYLAALAYQYATTHDAAAKARAQRALTTLRTLLTMRGDPGNMNRSIAPTWFLPAWDRPTTTYTPGKDYALPWNGDLYYFSDYMSRDEYMGLFYGLSIAHDLFDDATMKANAQQSMEMALDYLLRNNWTWRRRDGTWGERWAGVLDQQYAWILAAWHGNPAKYQAAHDQYRGFADIVWTGTWMAAMDPFFQYYKFQLGTGAIQILLGHETDPAAWMRAYQSVRIQRHYIGHHLNAHFNNVYLAADPSSTARLGAENENLLSRWLLWPRRRMVDNLHNDPSIEKIMYTPPLDNSGSTHPPAVEIAKYPLPPDKRIGTGFMWSSSPCELDPGYPSNPDAYREGETLDFVLPYWMARYYRAINLPTSTGGGSGILSGR